MVDREDIDAHDAGTIDERAASLSLTNQAMLMGFLDYLESLEAAKPRKQVR